MPTWPVAPAMLLRIGSGRVEDRVKSGPGTVLGTTGRKVLHGRADPLPRVSHCVTGRFDIFTCMGHWTPILSSRTTGILRATGCQSVRSSIHAGSVAGFSGADRRPRRAHKPVSDTQFQDTANSRSPFAERAAVVREPCVRAVRGAAEAASDGAVAADPAVPPAPAGRWGGNIRSAPATACSRRSSRRR